MVTATRKASRAMTALRETVLPHLEPMVSVETALSWTPAILASSVLIRVTSAWGSTSVWTITWTGFSSVTCTTSATDPTAPRTWASVTAWVGWTRNRAPPLKSMPKLRPGTIRLTSEMATSTAETVNHRRRRPTMSKLVSPWYRRLARDTDGILLAGSDGGADADEAPLLEQAESGEQGDRRPGEEPGGEEVDQGGQAEGEGEAPDRADGEDVQQQRGQERHRVGRDQGVERALPAPVDRGAQGLALAYLVLEPFEEHHVGVGRDADGHDQPGDAGQGQGEADQLAHEDDDADIEGGRDGQSDPDDQAEPAVVEQHVQEDQAEPDGSPDQAGVQRVGAQGGADGGAALEVELEGQGARGDQRGQVLGLGLGLAGDDRLAAADALVALDVGGDRRVVDDHRVQGDGDLALGVVLGAAGRLAGELLELTAAGAVEVELGLPLAGGDVALAGLLELGPGRADVGAAEGDRAHQHLGRVGLGPQAASLLARAQDDVLVGDVLVLVGRRLGAVDGVERGLLVLGVAGPDDLLDRAELELGGGADGGDHVVGVGHVGDGHHDVAALQVHLGLGHALGVDPVADDVDGGVELLGGGGAAPRVGGHEGDAGPAAQVEAEPGLDALDRDHPPDHPDQQEHDHQGDDVTADSWHGRLAPSGCKGSKQRA